MESEWVDDVSRREQVVRHVLDEERRGRLLPSGPNQERLTGDALGGVLEEFRSYLLTIAWQRCPANLGPKLGRSDLVQETLLKGYLKFDDFSGETREELKAWLRKILENLIKSRIRDFRTRFRDVTREETLTNQVAHQVGSSPSQALMASEQREQLMAALARLPERERQALLWVHRDNLPYRIVGERLGLSETGAQRVWARAVRALSRELGVKPSNLE